MKKTTKIAAALAILSSPAFAANLENPLYIPQSNEGFSKTAVGFMYKVTDDSDALVSKNHDGATEFPIWRFQQDLGYGITDRLSVRGQMGYTYNGDIDRKGLHLGRLGLNYRAFDGKTTNGIVADFYADAGLGGIDKMKGALLNDGFKYENYSTSQYAAWAGFNVGKTWNDMTAAFFAEYGYHFSSDNTEINIGDFTPVAPLLTFGLDETVVAKLGTSADYNVGAKFAYDFAPKWTSVFSLTYRHRGAHDIEGLEGDFSKVNPIALAAVRSGFAALENSFKGSMDDAYDEYALGATVGKQLTDNVLVSLYGEYVFDTAEEGSQNGTDNKAEMGVRLNAKF
jgi:hypothetical protein